MRKELGTLTKLFRVAQDKLSQRIHPLQQKAIRKEARQHDLNKEHSTRSPSREKHQENKKAPRKKRKKRVDKRAMDSDSDHEMASRRLHSNKDSPSVRSPQRKRRKTNTSPYNTSVLSGHASETSPLAPRGRSPRTSHGQSRHTKASAVPSKKDSRRRKKKRHKTNIADMHLAHSKVLLDEVAKIIAKRSKQEHEVHEEEDQEVSPIQLTPSRGGVVDLTTLNSELLPEYKKDLAKLDKANKRFASECARDADPEIGKVFWKPAYSKHLDPSKKSKHEHLLLKLATKLSKAYQKLYHRAELAHNHDSLHPTGKQATSSMRMMCLGLLCDCAAYHGLASMPPTLIEGFMGDIEPSKRDALVIMTCKTFFDTCRAKGFINDKG